MRYSELFRNSLKSLAQNKRRSFLSMLGIVIGITAVITILSLGRGFEKYTMKNLTQSEDSENVKTSIVFVPTDWNLYENQNFSPFGENDLKQIEMVEGVRKASFPKKDNEPVYTEVTVRGKKFGEIISFVEHSEGSLLVGRNLTKRDSEHHARVAIVGQNILDETYKEPEEILGHAMEFQGLLFTIVGVKESGGLSLFAAMEGNVLIPSGTKKYYLDQAVRRDTVEIEIQKGYKPTEVTNRVRENLEKQNASALLGTFESNDLSMLTDGIGKVLQMLTFFVSGVAGISLLIAGVGVMNMMYISVAERTREIGIRRAMGAKRRDIRFQFLLEGVFLTAIGGVIGYILGFCLASVISIFLPFSVSPDLFTITLAIGVATFIGIVFSMIPAGVAAKKDLIEILR